MSLESNGPEFFPAPTTRVDGFPAAITSDMGVDNDLSDVGTGIGFSKVWERATLEEAARRAALLVPPARRR